jgi:hypothetical protein
VIPVEDAVRVELEAIAWRDGLKRNCHPGRSHSSLRRRLEERPPAARARPGRGFLSRVRFGFGLALPRA